LAFYRKPLSRYGEVLECDQSKPVGSHIVTRDGLTCSDEHDVRTQTNVVRIPPAITDCALERHISTAS